MKLTPGDEAWLRKYRQALGSKFPGLVQQVILFGSKARGTATPDSDIDLVVVIREGDRTVKDAVAWAGDELAIGTDVVPSFVVYTCAEWDKLAASQAPFWRVVERDGVVVG